jgi:type III secretion protein Q
MLDAELLQRLPRVDSAQADAMTRLLAVLAHAGLRAAPWHEPEQRAEFDPATVWVAFDSDLGELRLAPLRAAGRPVAVRAASGRIDPAAVGNALEASEPLIGTLEQAFGSPLVPRSLHAGPRRGTCSVRLQSSDGHAARIGLAHEACERLLPPAMTSLPPALLPVRLPCRVALGSCLLSRDEWSALAIDDVLLPAHDLSSPWPVRATVFHQRHEATAWFRPQEGVLVFANQEHHPMSDPNSGRQMADPSSPGTSDWESLPVRVRFELQRVSVPLGVLAGLQPGAVIHVARSAQAISVDLLTDDRLIGRGEVVALGDGFGVRVRELLPASR